MARDRDLPSMPAALAHSIRFAYRAEPKLLLVSFALVVASWIPDAFGALWLKLLANGAVAGDGRRVAWAAAGLAGSGAAAWLLRIAGDRVHFLFRERATIAIEAHVARLQATVASIEHHERPEYLDRLQILRDQAFLLNHLYHSFMSTVGSVARLAITVVLLASVHPALIALALFAVPTVVVASWRAGTERKVWEIVAAGRRLDRHLLGLGTTAGPGKEIRLAGIGDRLARLRWSTWETWYGKIARNRSASASWAALDLGALRRGLRRRDRRRRHRARRHRGRRPAGARGRRQPVALSRHDGGAGGLPALVRRRRQPPGVARALRRRAPRAEPTRRCRPASSAAFASKACRSSIPAPTSGCCATSISSCPPDAVVAIVGENGAGKTTLVKLLCRFYEPTEGRITVDGVDLARLPAEGWRERLAGAFQDFMRFELRARDDGRSGRPAAGRGSGRGRVRDRARRRRRRGEAPAARPRHPARPHLA